MRVNACLFVCVCVCVCVCLCKYVCACSFVVVLGIRGYFGDFDLRSLVPGAPPLQVWCPGVFFVLVRVCVCVREYECVCARDCVRVRVRVRVRVHVHVRVRVCMFTLHPPISHKPKYTQTFSNLLPPPLSHSHSKSADTIRRHRHQGCTSHLCRIKPRESIQHHTPAILYATRTSIPFF